jgi:hypothetical protein
VPETIWPYEIATDATVEPESYYLLRCFVLIKSFPQDQWNDIFELIKAACEDARQQLQISRFDVIRATDIVSPGVIHYEIWTQLKQADIVIADLTDHNPNVMFEFGVAAAIKDKQRVILMREQTDQAGAFPFDVMPARHIVYKRTFSGLLELRSKLTQAVLMSLLAAPFESIPLFQPSLPLYAGLDDGHDNRLIWTSDTGHRRVLSDCLEFGSLHLPRYSWASVADLKLTTVRVQAEMRFTLRQPRPDDTGWLGISLRSQGFYANLGILIYIRPTGQVSLVTPTDDMGNMKDMPIGEVVPFADREPGAFATFDITIDDKKLIIKAGALEREVMLVDLPLVYTRGRVLFQTLFTRAALRRVRVTEVPPSDPAG